MERGSAWKEYRLGIISLLAAIGRVVATSIFIHEFRYLFTYISIFRDGVQSCKVEAKLIRMKIWHGFGRQDSLEHPTGRT